MKTGAIIGDGDRKSADPRGPITGSPHIRLEQTTFIGRVLCFVSVNFYYARGTRGLLVRGLEPKLRNRSEPTRRSNIVTRDET